MRCMNMSILQTYVGRHAQVHMLEGVDKVSTCMNVYVHVQQVLALGSFGKAWRFSGSSDFPILVRGELILAP